MKLGFIFDVRFIEYKGNYYSTNFSIDFWKKRYLNFFDEVTVIGRYERAEDDPNGRLVRSNSEKVHFCCVKNTSNINRIFTSSKQHSFIKNTIKDCDFVICRGWWGVSACKELHKPYMIEVVNCAWDAFWNHSIMGKLFALPNYLLQKNAVKYAPYVSYVTEEFLQKRYPCLNKTVGMSDVSIQKITDDIVLGRNYRIVKMNTNDITLMTSGAVNVRYKGQQYVIQAISKLNQIGVHVKYYCVGAGNQTYLKNIAKKFKVENQVVFTGSVPHEQVFELLDRCDIYIQPSLTEGLPRALVEAMSRGCPAIGTNIGGIPELLPEKCLVKRKSAGEIADTIIKMLNNGLDNYSETSFLRANDFRSEILDRRREEYFEYVTNSITNKIEN